MFAGSDNETIRRKPLPNDAGRKQTSTSTSAGGMSKTATIRMVQSIDEHLEPSENGQDSEGVGSLLPAVLRMSLEEPTTTNDDGTGTAATSQAPKAGHKVPGSSLDKSLPPTPDPGVDVENELGPGDNSHLKDGNYSTKELERSLGVSGVIDLRDEEDTSFHQHWNPPVTHETVRQDVHEIRHERVTRDVHRHHVYHRILPVRDIEVKPTRHFIEHENGNHQEVSEEQVPGRSPKLTHTVLNEVYRDMLPKDNDETGPRQFSARRFSNAEGDFKQYSTPDGPIRTERWWVHPPILETGAKEAGQTTPFHLNSANPADDGFRGYYRVGYSG